jgi:hypothetical protein
MAFSQTTPSQLLDGTPVKLRIGSTVSSHDAHVGDTVDFEVLEEITVNDIVIVKKGAVAIGTITDAQSKRRLGRGGHLSINIDYVRLADGEKAALRAIQGGKGGGHGTAVTTSVVATSLVFWPAAPLFLLMHGKDMTIPQGTPVTAYINGDFPIERCRFVACDGVERTYVVATSNPAVKTSTPKPSNPAVPNTESVIDRSGHVHQPAQQALVNGNDDPPTAADQQSGAWLGAESTDAPNVRHNGITLSDVDDHGPAYNAGLRAGDVILNVAGTYVYTVEDLSAEIQKHRSGSRIEVRYMRGASTNETFVVLGNKARL